jgi:hypothetical protein
VPKILIVLLAVASLGLASCGARQGILFHPPEVSFAALPPDAVEQAIFMGCSNRGWICSRSGAGTIDATLSLRAHSVTVRILYDRDSFLVKYDRSQNLRYRREPDGTETIHSNYNGWVRFLVIDITNAIEQQRIKKERPA